MATLYRKYRPQNWKEVVGQNHIKITLEHEISSGKLAHAYLFCGPRAVGKTTVARVLAKSVNCPKRPEGQSEPCNECQSCQDITIGKNLDIIEIDGASHTGVDNVRENIIAAARVSPGNSKFKVFIIDEVHMLSISAFNALLKVLEEPPADVIFILCTTEVHKIPATIISRCQRFDFKRISVSDIAKKLLYITNKEGIKIDSEILESVARHSEGHMRDAESYLGQIVAIGGNEITAKEADLVIPRSDLAEALKLISFLAKKDASSAIGLINKIIDEGVDLKKFISDTIEIMRKLMLSKISPALADKLSVELGESLEKKVSIISQDLEVGSILIWIDKFSIVKNKTKDSFIAQLPAEIAIVEICSSPPAARETSGFSAAPPAPSQAGPVGGANTSTVNKTQISSQALKKEEIILRWHEVLAKVKQHNHSLSFILRVCEPRDVNGKKLCLAFKYKFHKDRIGDSNIKSLVEKILYEVYGQPLIVEAVIDENIEIKEQDNGAKKAPDIPMPENVKNNGANSEKDENTLQNLIKNFGGKIVD